MLQPLHIINWRNSEITRRILSTAALDWTEIFGNAHPVDLEIGIGNGSFLVPFARDHARRNMVGIEMEGRYLRKADKKLSQQDLTNARLLIGDAKLLVWKLFMDGSLEDVYINYPDPWFKKRHKKRRLINPMTLRMLARKMNSVLTIATDDEEYRDFVIECVREVNCFENIHADSYVRMLENYYPTKYERKWKEQGKPVFYMQFRKTNNPDFDTREYINSQNVRFALHQLSEKAKPFAVINETEA